MKEFPPIQINQVPDDVIIAQAYIDKSNLICRGLIIKGEKNM